MAVIERQRAAADPPDQLAIVRRHDHGRAARVDLAEQVHDFEREVGIEVSGRLVAEDDQGIVHQCPRDGDPLLFAAGQLQRKRIHPMLQADPFQDLEGPPLLLRRRHAQHARNEGDVLQNGAAAAAA